MTIYAIVNTRTQRAYIGRSARVDRRWFEHRNDLRIGRHKSKALQGDWDRDGAVWFSFVRLEELPPLATKEQAAAREKWHLASTLDPYNQSASTLSGPPPGFIPSQQTREKISAALKGIRFSAAHRRSISESRKGRSFPHRGGYTLSAETRARMSESRRGRKSTAESRANQSAALKGRVFTEEWKAKIRTAKAGVAWSAKRRAAFAAAKVQRELGSGCIERVVEHRYDNSGGARCT